jgi:hypothetical protein
LPTVVIAVLAGVVAFDVWLFFFHGIGASLERVLSEPLLLLALVGLTLVSAAFHELGHAAACCYGGGQPGPIGVGIYVLWPAFFSDVTDSYRLSKGGRLRTDLGGLYFNGVFVVAIAGAYFATKFEPLLLLAVVQHVMVLEQLLPFVRLDGYYVLSDLSGVPDPFQRVRPVLKSLLRGSEGRRAVADLKPRVRAVITGWIFLTVPVLAATVGVFVAKGPPYVVASWDSLVSQAQNLGHALEEGQLVTGLLVAVQVLALAIPLAGIALIVLRVFRRIRNRALSLLFVILVAALIARVPIRERQTATQLAASVTTGSCSLDEKTDPGRLHVKSPSYAVDPPSGGDHHRVPAKPGIYAAPDAPPDGELVHSQEHGYVVLWYSPQLPDHEMATLLSVAHRFRKDVLVIPRPSLQVQVAATAWHRRLLCGRVEAAALATFIETYRNKGPERIPHSSQPREASKTNEEGSEGVGSAPDSTAPQREDHDSAQPRLQPPRLGADRIGCRHLLCDPTGANRVTS